MRRRTLLKAASAGIIPAVFSVRAGALSWHAEYDVVVIGGGAAGLSAAAAASEKGARTALFEKEPRIGGDTLISGGYFNAPDPARQKPMGIHDSPDFFASQILRTGAGLNSPEVVATFARESLPTLKWLESLGMKFLPEVVEVFGGSWPRSHKPVLPRGTGYVAVLSEACSKKNVMIRTGAPVTGLLRDEKTGRFCGVRVTLDGRAQEVRARRGVVIASGGFGASREMRRRYAPATADLPSDSRPGATGEMIEEAARCGASVARMDIVECVPGSAAGISYPIRLDYMPSYMIIVNSRGKRFVDETKGRREIAAAVLSEMKRGPCYCIASGRALEFFDPVSKKNLFRGLYAGQAWRADSPRELARETGLPPEALASEIHAAEKTRSFEEPPFWAVKMFLRVHTTLGGIETDEKARVLGPDGKALPGLWAAGGTTGSVHGAERIGGNGIAAACTFGRIAGAEAANSSV